MSRLEAYKLPDIGTLELANQRALIERIAAGEVALDQEPTDQ